MALTMATALSIVACRVFHPGWFERGTRLELMFYARTTVIIFTIALTWLIFHDRLPVRRAVRYPGRACVLVLTLMIPFAAITKWAQIFSVAFESIPAGVNHVLYSTVLDVNALLPAYCTLTTWVVIWLRRDALLARDWIERVGIMIGMFWILTALTLDALYNF